MVTMTRVFVCRAPGEVEIAYRPMPVPGPDDVLLRISRAGICGTDYHIYAGLHPFLEYPRVLGHELSGTILQAPANSGLEIGQLVAVNPYLACGKCHACKAQKPNCCMRIAVLGVHTDGGMAEFVSVPATNVIRVDGLDAEQAASIEFLAIGAHAVSRARVGSGARVLVVGAGPIGIGAALFARIAGGDVTMMDRDPARLALAGAATGIADLALADDKLAETVAALTEGNGFDVVLEATGNARSMESSFNHVAHGGALVLVGLVKSALSSNDPDLHRREMSVFASRNATRADFDTVIAAIRTGDVVIDRLVTHRTTLDRICADLPAWAENKTGLIKAMVRVD